MPTDEDLNWTADLCIEACRAVFEHGTPEMHSAASVLLMVVGKTLAKRMSKPEAIPDFQDEMREAWVARA